MEIFWFLYRDGAATIQWDGDFSRHNKSAFNRSMRQCQQPQQAEVLDSVYIVCETTKMLYDL